LSLACVYVAVFGQAQDNLLSFLKPRFFLRCRYIAHL